VEEERRSDGGGRAYEQNKPVARACGKLARPANLRLHTSKVVSQLLPRR
jgi:hypothetical protein